ncbi:ABC transporter ATP-binding protein [bacterium]|nr:ABC transporter ATP-binding protein [bacterium]
MSALLSIRQLNIVFQGSQGTTHAVRNLNLEIPKGKVVGLVGESGSGKSVTSLSVMRLLSSVNSKVTGEILFENQNLVSLPEPEMRKIRGQKISMIFQEPMTSLNPVFRVGYQLMEGLRLHKKMSFAEAQEKAESLLDQVGLPDPKQKMKFYPHELSGGQRQRVMIAMAIACEPQLLIADEPTTALDVTIQKQILDLLQKLQAELGMAMLFITHDLSIIRKMANEVTILHKGVCVESGKTEDIFSKPQHPYTKGLLNCRPQVHPHAKRLPTINDYMTEDGAEKSFDVSSLGRREVLPLNQKDALLIVKNLQKYYPIKSSLFNFSKKWVKAVDDVSFQLQQGRVLGLVGESGCGKTTLGRTLLRLIEPTGGEIIYRHKNLCAMEGEELRHLRQKIQIVFQDPYSSLNPRMTIGRAITEPMKVHNLYKDQQERWARAEDLMKKVGLKPEFLNRYPHEFSGGQRQRVCIARALAVNPEFIVCDESVSALDVSVQAQILNLLMDLKDEFKLTYVFISHDLSVVRFIADEVAVMNQGRIVEHGLVDDIYKSPQNEYTRKLLSSIL